MMKANVKVNNEFYISETFNFMIKDGYKVGAYKIKNEEHCPIGVPEDLERYINENRKV